MDEMLILVDPQDNVIGSATKMAVHRHGLLHRAFSIFIFNRRGELLLQKRAAGKYHSGGLWTNSCCGHPRRDECTYGAARRRLQEEMGFSCELWNVLDLTYRARVAEGWQWADIDTVNRQIRDEPHIFTCWFHEILDYISLNDLRRR